MTRAACWVLGVVVSGLIPAGPHCFLLSFSESLHDKLYGVHLAPGACWVVLAVYTGASVAAGLAARLAPRGWRAGAFAWLVVVGWGVAACNPWWDGWLCETRGVSGEVLHRGVGWPYRG